MTLFISGALVMGYWVAGLFFFRFWRQSRDRLFAIFGAAFWVLGLQRLALASAAHWSPDTIWLYVVRLAAFLLILWAIADKNRATR